MDAIYQIRGYLLNDGISCKEKGPPFPAALNLSRYSNTGDNPYGIRIFQKLR
jgi:hypothetical protein